MRSHITVTYMRYICLIVYINHFLSIFFHLCSNKCVWITEIHVHFCAMSCSHYRKITICEKRCTDGRMNVYYPNFRQQYLTMVIFLARSQQLIYIDMDSRKYEQRKSRKNNMCRAIIILIIIFCGISVNYIPIPCYRGEHTTTTTTTTISKCPKQSVARKRVKVFQSTTARSQNKPIDWNCISRFDPDRIYIFITLPLLYYCYYCYYCIIIYWSICIFV